MKELIEADGEWSDWEFNAFELGMAAAVNAKLDTPKQRRLFASRVNGMRKGRIARAVRGTIPECIWNPPEISWRYRSADGAIVIWRQSLLWKWRSDPQDLQTYRAMLTTKTRILLHQHWDFLREQYGGDEGIRRHPIVWVALNLADQKFLEDQG